MSKNTSSNYLVKINLRNKVKKELLYFKQFWGLYLLFLPTLIYILVFLYGPMYGVIIAFKDFSSTLGILGSPWVGLKYFNMFFKSYNFWNLIKNTLTLSLYAMLAGFPIPIIFALFLNHLNNKYFKKLVQTISYAPYFISTVVLVGMLSVFLAPSTGIVNIIIKMFGGTQIYFLGKASYFIHVYVWSGIWQTVGWSSIIYVATLANVSPEYHEAAIIDGASKLQRIRYVDIPFILPTAMTLLILNAGSIMSVGFEKAFLMQNNLNIQTSEIISTYVYRIGLLDGQISFSTAVGLFNSVICCIMVVIVNSISRKLTETSLW